MKHSALSVAAMGTALVWPVFLISTVSAKAVDRKSPHPTASTTDSVQSGPSLSSTSWVWPSADTSSESFSVAWTYSSGAESVPTSFPVVPTTSRSFVISPLGPSDYPTTPVFAPQPTKRDDVTPTSIPDGDNWSWSDLPHSSTTKDWSSIFDGLISSYIKSAASHPLPEWASDVTSTPAVMATTTVWATTTATPTPTSDDTTLVTTTVTVTRTRPRSRSITTDPVTAGTGPVVKNVVTTQTWTFVSPLKGHNVRDAITAPDTLITKVVCAKETTSGVPKRGCVQSPVCGSDRKTLTTTPGLNRRISTSTCVEHGTTCSIDGVLNPSDDWCAQDCICACQ